MDGSAGPVSLALLSLLAIFAFTVMKPVEGVVNVNSQEALTVIQAQLEEGNKVLLDDMEITEKPSIYTTDKFTYKVETDAEGNEVYQFNLKGRTGGTAVVPMMLPMR